MKDFVKAAIAMQNRPLEVHSTVKMPNGRVLAETVAEENNNKYNRRLY